MADGLWRRSLQEPGCIASTGNLPTDNPFRAGWSGCGCCCFKEQLLDEKGRSVVSIISFLGLGNHGGLEGERDPCENTIASTSIRMCFLLGQNRERD